MRLPQSSRPTAEEAVSKLDPLSAEGAKCNSLGHRPRKKALKIFQRWKRVMCWRLHDRYGSSRYFLFRAFSAPKFHRTTQPRALPWAFTFRAFGAVLPRSFSTGVPPVNHAQDAPATINLTSIFPPRTSNRFVW